MPAFTPLGASERVGVVGVQPGSVWKADLTLGGYDAGGSWLDLLVPRVPVGTTAAARYTGNDPDGWVSLTPATLEFTVETETRIEPRFGQEMSVQGFTIQVQAGTLPGVLVVEPPGFVTERSWQVIGGATPWWWRRGFRSVPAPAEGTGLVNVLPARLWLVAFARPATGQLTLESATPTLEPAGACRGSLRRYTVSTVCSRKMQPHASGPAIKSWGFSGLYLVTAVRAPADVMVVFGGTVTAAKHTVLPITMPPGAEEPPPSMESGSPRFAACFRRWHRESPAPIAGSGALRGAVSAGYRGYRPRDNGPHSRAEASRGWGSAAMVGLLFGGAGGLAGAPVWTVACDATSPMIGDVPLLVAGVVVLRLQADEMRVATTGTANAGRRLCSDDARAGVGGGRAPPPVLRLAACAVAVRRRNSCERLTVVAACRGGAADRGFSRRWRHGRRAGAIANGCLRQLRLSRSCVSSWNPDTVAQQPAPVTVAILPAGKDGRETAAPAEVRSRSVGRTPAHRSGHAHYVGRVYRVCR
ncbi:MAG: hypothetical protein U0792_09270 [Gemmataceae bacterium]